MGTVATFFVCSTHGLVVIKSNSIKKNKKLLYEKEERTPGEKEVKYNRICPQGKENKIKI